LNNTFVNDVTAIELDDSGVDPFVYYNNVIVGSTTAINLAPPPAKTATLMRKEMRPATGQFAARRGHHGARAIGIVLASMWAAPARAAPPSRIDLNWTSDASGCIDATTLSTTVERTMGRSIFGEQERRGGGRSRQCIGLGRVHRAYPPSGSRRFDALRTCHNDRGGLCATR
jgi:hypothetical protein